MDSRSSESTRIRTLRREAAARRSKQATEGGARRGTADDEEDDEDDEEIGSGSDEETDDDGDDDDEGGDDGAPSTEGPIDLQVPAPPSRRGLPFSGEAPVDDTKVRRAVGLGPVLEAARRTHHPPVAALPVTTEILRLLGPKPLAKRSVQDFDVLVKAIIYLEPGMSIQYASDFILTGRSGVGKSTFLRVLARVAANILSLRALIIYYDLSRATPLLSPLQLIHAAVVRRAELANDPDRSYPAKYCIFGSRSHLLDPRCEDKGVEIEVEVDEEGEGGGATGKRTSGEAGGGAEGETAKGAAAGGGTGTAHTAEPPRTTPSSTPTAKASTVKASEKAAAKKPAKKTKKVRVSQIEAGIPKKPWATAAEMHEWLHKYDRPVVLLLDELHALADLADRKVAQRFLKELYAITDLALPRKILVVVTGRTSFLNARCLYRVPFTAPSGTSHDEFVGSRYTQMTERVMGETMPDRLYSVVKENSDIVSICKYVDLRTRYMMALTQRRHRFRKIEMNPVDPSDESFCRPRYDKHRVLHQLAVQNWLEFTGTSTAPATGSSGSGSHSPVATGASSSLPTCAPSVSGGAGAGADTEASLTSSSSASASVLPTAGSPDPATSVVPLVSTASPVPAPTNGASEAAAIDASGGESSTKSP